jgi:chemotaxis protein methyltransferase CheR
MLDGDTEAAIRERRALVNAMTTNVTSLFRERHHFSTMADHVARQLADRSRREVTVWSAGGADGSEAVSAALSIAAATQARDLERWHIVMTDIDDDAIDAAEAGRYPLSSLTPEDRARFAPFFVVEEGVGAGTFTLRPDVKARIGVRRHNLVRAPAPASGFDAVFCRNVLIYFDEATKHVVQETLVSAVRPGGMLFLGHSERLLETAVGADQMTRVGITSFRRELAGRRIACQ